MKYIFCSLMFDDVESDINKSKNPNTVSGHTFQENILRGLMQNGADVQVVNIPRIRHYPDYPEKRILPRDFFLDGKKAGKSIGFCNRFLLSYFSSYASLKKELNHTLAEMENEECVLIVFNSHLIQSLAALKMRRKYANVKLCDVIGDFHGSYGLLRKNASMKERLVDLFGRAEDFLAKRFDYYVFLSPHMREIIPCGDSQYTVLEGIYYHAASGAVTEKSVDDETTTLLYAGSLDVEYDIEHLINAFMRTTDSRFRLQVAGSGNGLDIVRKAAETDSRIQYLGVLSPGNLLDYQLRATAFISPRRNCHNYVKYSFPSKTMECLALGKPYIAHRLDSEPPDYSAYIHYAAESDLELAEKIEEVLTMKREDREAAGRKSREFILRQKNPKTMCKRILDLCEGHPPET